MGILFVSCLLVKVICHDAADIAIHHGLLALYSSISAKVRFKFRGWNFSLNTNCEWARKENNQRSIQAFLWVIAEPCGLLTYLLQRQSPMFRLAKGLFAAPETVRPCEFPFRHQRLIPGNPTSGSVSSSLNRNSFQLQRQMRLISKYSIHLPVRCSMQYTYRNCIHLTSSCSTSCRP